MNNSLPYENFIISYLKNPEFAAKYIEAFFQEENPESELLNMVLSNVAISVISEKNSENETKLYLEKLQKILAQPTHEGIYNLALWLNSLGLKLTVAVRDDNSHEIRQTDVKYDLKNSYATMIN